MIFSEMLTTFGDVCNIEVVSERDADTDTKYTFQREENIMTTTKQKQTTSANHPVEVGHFVQEQLVTDTKIYEVIRVTDKTITIRETQDGRTMDNDDLAVVLIEAVSDVNGREFTLRLRKDGTFRKGNHVGARALRLARTYDNVPVRKIDLTF